jgi:hypothetical protein
MAERSRRLRLDGLTMPLPGRLLASHPRYPEVLDAHTDAMSAGVPAYRDPYSGLSVFTAAFLADRGYCCESGCRHCPFVQHD